MIRPTVGRIVHFYKASGRPFGEPPFAAIIARVISDNRVNLAIFNANGEPYLKPPTSVLLVQPEAERPEEGQFCEWMPYQVKKPTGSESGERSAGLESI